MQAAVDAERTERAIPDQEREHAPLKEAAAHAETPDSSVDAPNGSSSPAQLAQPLLPDLLPGPVSVDDAMTEVFPVAAYVATGETVSPSADEINARSDRMAEPDSALQSDRVASAPADRRSPATPGFPAQRRAQRRPEVRKVPRGLRPRLAVLFVAALVLVAAGSVIFALSRKAGSGTVSDALGSRAGASQADSATRNHAAMWVTQQVSHAATVSCDPAMCSALEAHGFPSGSLHILGPTATYPLGSALVIETPAVRSQFGTSLGSTYAPAVIASFGSGNAQIQVRLIAPRGVAAYRSALSADLQVRKASGLALLTSSRIRASSSAASQLAGGQVDSRLVLAIADMAAVHPVDIVGFGNLASGVSAGVPLRFADLAATDGAAHMGSSAYVRSLIASLHGQRPFYRPLRTEIVRLPDGQSVLRVEFAAPSPLGLLRAQSP